VHVGGVDVGEAIRTTNITARVSVLATNLVVRAELGRLQREAIDAETRPGSFSGGRGVVAEGRDITTVVAPDAAVRVLLVADPAARVARRHAELGEHIDSADVTDQVIRRDQDDSAVAQFHSAAPGVTEVDSTYLTLEQVIDAICELVPVGAGGDQLP